MIGKASKAIAKQRVLLEEGRDITIRKLRSSIIKSRTKAVEIFIVPRAKGRFCVRVTCVSMRLSHRSLAIQPAALTNNPPKMINNMRPPEGGALGAIQSDHPAGINKIRRPLGLFQRINSAHWLKRL